MAMQQLRRDEQRATRPLTATAQQGFDDTQLKKVV